MAQLFQPPDAAAQPWRLSTLAADAYELRRGEAGGLHVVAAEAARRPSAAPLLLRVGDSPGGAQWALISLPDSVLRVNGWELAVGVRRLEHRDEIRIGDARAWFSTEELAAVEPYARDDAPRCPRCLQPVEAGQASVRCPRCAVVHHATEALGCWTYAARCALCEQPTSLDAGFQFSPEDL